METTVGDDREACCSRFSSPGSATRSSSTAVGPTVDDLSQEIAAQAAGVELALSEVAGADERI